MNLVNFQKYLTLELLALCTSFEKLAQPISVIDKHIIHLYHSGHPLGGK